MCAFTLLLAIAAAVAGTDVALLKPPLVEDPVESVYPGIRNEGLHGTRATVSNSASVIATCELQGAGYITVRSDPADARARVLHLTKSGSDRCSIACG